MCLHACLGLTATSSKFVTVPCGLAMPARRDLAGSRQPCSWGIVNQQVLAYVHGVLVLDMLSHHANKNPRPAQGPRSVCPAAPMLKRLVTRLHGLEPPMPAVRVALCQAAHPCNNNLCCWGIDEACTLRRQACSCACERPAERPVCWRIADISMLPERTSHVINAIFFATYTHNVTWGPGTPPHHHRCPRHPASHKGPLMLLNPISEG
jgi:hypothetical protein